MTAVGYKDKLEHYLKQLETEEKSQATQKKYARDIRMFIEYAKEREMEKGVLLEYKDKIKKEYAMSSVNSMLAAVNSFLRFCRREDCCVKLIKMQRQIFCREEKELTREEYQRLLAAAGEKKDKRLYLMLQTICATGIRVSELKYITKESVCSGRAVVESKGKNRVILLPTRLCVLLKQYIKKTPCKTGSIFVTKSGRPMDRSNIWREMKGLCVKAGVSGEKVFPHNLRHLFARCFYAMTRDIAKLADILGHSSVDTTRIYMVSNGTEHRSQMDKMDLMDHATPIWTKKTT